MTVCIEPRDGERTVMVLDPLAEREELYKTIVEKLRRIARKEGKHVGLALALLGGFFSIWIVIPGPFAALFILTVAGTDCGRY